MYTFFLVERVLSAGNIICTRYAATPLLPKLTEGASYLMGHRCQVVCSVLWFTPRTDYDDSQDSVITLWRCLVDGTFFNLWFHWHTFPAQWQQPLIQGPFNHFDDQVFELDQQHHSIHYSDCRLEKNIQYTNQTDIWHAQHRSWTSFMETGIYT